jgi:hypothetical protein
MGGASMMIVFAWLFGLHPRHLTLLDGKALQFPSYRDTAAIEQARGCADDLRKFLKGRTGEQVLVTPVVALPGWFVKDRMEAKASGVLAINPKMGTMLLKQPGAALQASQRNRIVSAIAERYPEIDT